MGMKFSQENKVLINTSVSYEMPNSSDKPIWEGLPTLSDKISSDKSEEISAR